MLRKILVNDFILFFLSHQLIDTGSLSNYVLYCHLQKLDKQGITSPTTSMPQFFS